MTCGSCRAGAGCRQGWQGRSCGPGRLDPAGPDLDDPPPAATPTEATAAKSAIEARIAAAMDQLRELHEFGEIDWIDVSPQAAYEMAFLGD